MQAEIHPEYYKLSITCSKCGNVIETGSVLPSLDVSICNKCHAAFLGSSGTTYVDAEGRVEKFMKKFEKSKALKTQKAVEAGQKA
ncbi:MAG: 50S ribosomal protein L31 [Vampirovibrionales bacterium]|nr:50S ribosomal protein L31 [Vampirovibrionales bacterium]